MNILFVAFLNPDRKSGVEKKILGQIRALEKLDNQVDYFTFQDGRIWLNRSNTPVVPLFKTRRSPVGAYLALEKATCYMLRCYRYNIAYLRHSFCSPLHLDTLALAKKRHVKTVEELPTYPYDAESKHFSSLSYRFAAIVDKISRRYYKRRLDYFATYSSHISIYGVQAIRLENGYDVDDVDFEETSFPENELDIIAVSSMISQHGYERFIHGLHQYKAIPSSVTVRFHLVGEGPQRLGLQKLVADYAIEDSVFFYGFLEGKPLEDIYRKCQMGCGALGGYKIGLEKASPLKNREYMAYGKMVIYAMEDAELGRCRNYCLQVPNDSSPVDISSVVSFYLKVRKAPNLAANIHRFAQEHFAWETQMMKVISVVGQK